MSILYWEKPKKKMTTEEWMAISADGAPPGVYHPNMSQEDNLKWKAKYIGGTDPRIEIRKSFHYSNGKPYGKGLINYGSQTLLVIRLDNSDHPDITFSTNGKIGMSFDEAKELSQAIEEAVNYLKEKANVIDDKKNN